MRYWKLLFISQLLVSLLPPPHSQYSGAYMEPRTIADTEIHGNSNPWIWAIPRSLNPTRAVFWLDQEAFLRLAEAMGCRVWPLWASDNPVDLTRFTGSQVSPGGGDSASRNVQICRCRIHDNVGPTVHIFMRGNMVKVCWEGDSAILTNSPVPTEKEWNSVSIIHGYHECWDPY